MESVGRLAGGIAHDFNNVLTVVLTTTELLAQDAPDEDARRDLRTIQDACQKASSLTKQLLALGGRQILQPEVIDLNQLLREDEALVRSLIPENISFTIRAAPDLGNILFDPGRLEQVLLNLVVNAVDAMPAGGQLTIETRNVQLDEGYAERHLEVEPGSYVVLLVSDTGTGMDSETMENIFEPFFTTKAPGKGTGLGLASTYGIVGQSGGHIWVYSEVGRGTMFKIYIPRVDEGVSSVATSRPERRTHRTGATESVLVVDDDVRLGHLVARILERAGYTVHTAENGADALRFIETHDGPLDLVLTDLTMPEMGGRDLAHRLGESHASIRFLYMSGYADEAAAPIARGDFLEKPFTPAQLLGRIEDILRG